LRFSNQIFDILIFTTAIFFIAFQMQNPESYQAATTALDVEHQALLMEVMRIAEMHAASRVGA